MSEPAYTPAQLAQFLAELHDVRDETSSVALEMDWSSVALAIVALGAVLVGVVWRHHRGGQMRRRLKRLAQASHADADWLREIDRLLREAAGPAVRRSAGEVWRHHLAACVEHTDDADAWRGDAGGWLTDLAFRRGICLSKEQADRLLALVLRTLPRLSARQAKEAP